ncbi:MAG: ABC transporter permease [Lachnospiraceae bacterium]|nr:ABC transporter permease [Lachnospiraceae bacterium]
MFFRILKKDLIRKKTMNIVLMIFVLLSAMFASSSMNNMIAVYGGIDYYFDKAGMSDYIIIVKNRNGVDLTSPVLEGAKAVKDYKKEDVFYYSSANLKVDGEKYATFENAGILLPIGNACLSYFDTENEPITKVEKGHVYLAGVLADPKNTCIGDVFCLDYGDRKAEFVIDGYIKDALLGSPFMGNPRMLMNDEDAEQFFSDVSLKNSYSGSIYYVNSDNVKELTEELTDVKNAMFSGDRGMIKMTYMLEMLVAGLLLAVSICLILIAFAMLSFTIKFTLEEDFREIGVMKAVGIKTRAIRSMYIVKYFCLACVGAAIGYIFSIPFGNVMLETVTENILIGNENRVLVGVISALAVVALTVAFCYSCTRGIKKMSPIDAVHNGETGERYHRKSVLRLSKSRLGSNLFLGLNDVFGKPKQYASMIATFTVCLLLIAMLATAANTLMSDKLIFLFGTTKSDVYYSSTEKIMGSMGNEDEDYQQKVIEDIENTLAKNGMPGKVHEELMYQIPVTFKGRNMMISMQHCADTKTTDYVYEDGVAPLYEDEVAFTPQIMDELGAKLGDKVVLEINGQKKECIITGTFISMNILGKVGRLHESVDLIPNMASSGYAFQIDFDDDPTSDIIDERIERLKEIFETEEIYNAADYVKTCTGSADVVMAGKNLVLVIALLISALTAVLMERSFISKETTEIALMKAIGFKNRWISAQHTCRFVTVMLISLILASLLNYPVTKLICDFIFANMGAISGITYEIKPLEVYGLYPLMLTAAVVAASGVTSLYARGIHADSMGNIE